jgi:hypothetical protein
MQSYPRPTVTVVSPHATLIQTLFSMRTYSHRRIFAYCWALYAHNAVFLSGLFISLGAFVLGSQFLALVLMQEVSVYVGGAVALYGWIFTTVLGMGILYISITLSRKRRVRHEDLLTPAPALIRFIAGSLLYHLIILMGLIFFIVPGFVWAIKYMFYRHLIIDQDLDVFQALYISGRMTEGIRVQLFALALGLSAINLLGALALGVGLLVTVPFTQLVLARVYDRRLILLQEEIEGLAVPASSKVA